jgi:hypothetical protein
MHGRGDMHKKLVVQVPEGTRPYSVCGHMLEDNIKLDVD